MDNFKFMVGLQAGRVVVMNLAALAAGMTKDDAIELAAWLCLLAGDVEGEKVRALLEEAPL